MSRLAAWIARLRAHGWFRYAVLAVLVGTCAVLRGLADPPGPLGIVELQVAGTRETVLSLLASADRAVLASALLWDYALIAAYGLLLPLALVAFRPEGEVAAPDRYAPWLAGAAAVLDLIQNLVVRAELGNLSGPLPDIGDWLPALAASCSLLSWTLLLMCVGRLAWLLACFILRNSRSAAGLN